MATKGILEQLAEGVVLGDGGYIIELEQRGWVVTGAFTPEISMTHPGAVRELAHGNEERRMRRPSGHGVLRQP